MVRICQVLVEICQENGRNMSGFGRNLSGFYRDPSGFGRDTVQIMWVSGSVRKCQKNQWLSDPIYSGYPVECKKEGLTYFLFKKRTLENFWGNGETM